MIGMGWLYGTGRGQTVEGNTRPNRLFIQERIERVLVGAPEMSPLGLGDDDKVGLRG